MASNKPENFSDFCGNIQSSSINPTSLEVLVLVDDDDDAMYKCVNRERKKRPFPIKMLSKPPNGYFNLWSGLNELHQLCDPNAYFVCNVNDEVRFETKGWDENLKKYVRLFPDDIFRLRTSQFKLRNYRDFWECGYAPENYAFYTKKWIDIAGGDWNACHGPDAYQQFIAFYLWNSNYPAKEQYYRDYPLLDIEISGEGAFLDLSEEQFWDRVKKGWVAWYKMVSHKMQEEANRRAQLLRAHIDASQLGLKGFKLNSNATKRRVELIDQDNFSVLDTRGRPHFYSYKLSWLRITLTNLLRRPLQNYYCGGGRDILLETILNIPFQILFPNISPKSRFRRYCLSILHRIFKPTNGIAGIASNSAPHAPSYHLCDGTMEPWGSQETDEDTYFYIKFQKKICPTRLEIILHSPGGRAHLRDVCVVVLEGNEPSTQLWRIALSRRINEEKFREKITIPPSQDYTKEILEIDPDFKSSGGVIGVGLACLSSTKNYERNYLDEGKGIYVRSLVVR